MERGPEREAKGSAESKREGPDQLQLGKGSVASSNRLDGKELHLLPSQLNILIRAGNFSKQPITS